MKLKLFFSWQEETDLQGFKNKQFLIDCIQSAIKQIEDKGKLKGVTIEFHEGLRNIAGNPSVAAEMFRQIDESDIFIGDMTVVQRLCDRAENLRNKHYIFMRYTPNSNVYGEYNRALGKHSAFCNQIILLMNKANRSVYDDRDIIPFDTRDRRWPLDFTLTSNDEESERIAKEDLMKYLPGAIALCAHAAIEYTSKRYWPFVTWYSHKEDGTLSPSRISDETADKFRARIFGKEGTACVIGPKGRTKTELVLRACREYELANNYLYVDNIDHEYSEYKKTLESIFQNTPEAILVVDNCNEELLSKILHIKKRLRAGNKIIALFDKVLEGKANLFDYKFYQLDANDLIEQNVEITLNEKGVLDSMVRERVKEFYQDNVQLISNLDGNVTNLADARSLTPKFLTNQLLKTEGEDLDRVIMRSLAMFEYFGWKGDRSEELEYIITDKNITSVDKDSKVILNKAVSIIKKGLKLGYFECKGRTVSVSPKAMAMQLIVEWLESADEQRLLNVIQSVARNKNGKRLLREFHDRFKYLGSSEEAVAMIANILSPGSIFEKMEVLNTNDVALLMECFSQVNPNAVADLLTRVIGTMSQEQLESLEDGRRYIVWTLDKLCFRSDTFNQSAALMLRLANAENEQISNNATAQFIGLFPVMLPATETNLLIRLDFLKAQFNMAQDKRVLMSALKRALTYRDFILFGGAETMGDKKLEPYKPKSFTEIASYFKGCLSILLNEVDESEYASSAIKILEDTVISLCDGGFASLVLPVIKKIAEQKNYEWDKMQHTLCFFFERVKNELSPDDQKLYKELMKDLTKTDPISRFLRVEKESYYGENGMRQSYEERMKKNQETFDTLAHEFFEKRLLDKDTLCKLIRSENIFTNPFGHTLAKLMPPDEQIMFVHNIIDAINVCDKPSIDILCQFISEVDDEIFAKVKPELKHSKVTYTLFACFGIRNIKPNENVFKDLREMVITSNASVEDYHQYWTRLVINQITEDDCIKLFDEILSFKGGFPVVVRMSFFLLMDKKVYEHKKLAEFMVQAFLNYKEGLVVAVDMALNNAEALMRALDCPGLAHRINEEILEYIKDSQTSLSHNYEFEITYRLMMIKYFNVIWPSLSQCLLADGDEFMAYYNMKWFLGVDMVDNDNPIINEGSHFEEMKPWLEAHPDIAPARLASIIQVANEQGEFTPEAMYLINTYGNDKNVLTELGCSLDSFVSVGSVLPQYEHRRNIYSKLLNHKIEEVRLWAQSQVNSCNYMIAYEGNREQEKI